MVWGGTLLVLLLLAYALKTSAVYSRVAVSGWIVATPLALSGWRVIARAVFGRVVRQVKPGITGWAQINGWRGETDDIFKMEKRVEHNLWYIRNWSLWLDLKIVFLTTLRGFSGATAY